MSDRIVTRNGEKIWRTQDGDRLDLIAFEVYGSTPEATEKLAAANPDLAFAVLPAGLEIILPELPSPATRRIRRLFE